MLRLPNYRSRFETRPLLAIICLAANKLYGGNGKFVGGAAGEPAVLEGNEAFPLGEVPRPRPAVSSIYE